MKDILGLRSVPLSATTMNAWRESGVLFRKRGRKDVWNGRYHNERVRAVLNLGNIDMTFRGVPVPVFNPPGMVLRISAPMALRKTLDDFLPQRTIQGPHWHKRPGMKGEGKVFHEDSLGVCAVTPGDVQAHIEGTEYRVLTVGDVVVQATRKTGSAPTFEFEWVGVQGINKSGIIPYLKEAIASIPKGQFSVIGWDIIVGDNGPRIIEANTSPGVNSASAARVVAQIREML